MPGGQLTVEKLVWEGVPALGLSGTLAVLGSTRSWLPWGLFALREGRQQRASATGQGRAAESCCHGYGVLHGEALWAF